MYPFPEMAFLNKVHFFLKYFSSPNILPENKIIITVSLDYLQ